MNRADQVGREQRRADRTAFRASRAVLAARDGRPRIADIAYVAYAGLLVTLIVGAPLVRFAVLGLIEPDAAAVVSATRAGVASAVGALAVLVAVLGGRVRGPVVPRPAAVQFLAGSPLPRRLTLRRPFVASALALTGGGVLAGGVVGLSRLLLPGDGAIVAVGATSGAVVPIGLAGPAQPAAVVAFLLGVVGFCLLLAVVWLVGQRGSRRALRTIAIVAGVTGVLGLVSPALLLATPWGWLALLWSPLAGGVESLVIAGALSGNGGFGLFGVSGGWFAAVGGAPVSWWPTVLLLLLGCLALVVVPRSLDALRSGPMLDQSQRWQRMGTLLQSGDAAGAMGGLRSVPTRGRRIPLAMTGPFPLVVLRRAVVGLRRTPGRAVLGSAVLFASGAAVGVALGLPDGVRWMLAVPAAFLAFLAVGVWCGAVRHGVDSAGTPSLYGRGPLALVLAGAIAPLGAAVVLGGLGAVLGGLGSQPGFALGWWVVLAGWTVVLRVFDAAKGPLPITLLMPVPTPVGDVSSANVLLWQSDAVLLALLVGGGATALLPVAPGAAIIALLVMLALIGALAVARVRKLSRPA